MTAGDAGRLGLAMGNWRLCAGTSTTAQGTQKGSVPRQQERPGKMHLTPCAGREETEQRDGSHLMLLTSAQEPPCLQKVDSVREGPRELPRAASSVQ